jgi:peptidoglycan-associated lipoprotein
MANKGALRVGTLVLALGVGLVFAGCASRKKTEPAPTPSVTHTEPTRPSDTSGGVPEKPEPVKVYDLSDIHFDFDKYDLRPGDRDVLTSHGKWLSDNGSVRVLIEGHCDERGTVEYNLALGEKRARTARDFLVNYGVPADRVEIISYGKERPLDPRHSEDAWASNRRCHFVKR